MIRWVAARVALEVIRDRRTLAMFLLVPVAVMTLIYYAIVEDETARVAVVTRGVARLFEPDILDALDQEDELVVVELDIDDEEADPEVVRAGIQSALENEEVEAVLYIPETLLTDRFAGKAGTLQVWIEGSRPTLTGTALGGVQGAMDDLAAALPTVIDASCPDLCADSVNTQPMELEKNYLVGSDDYRTIDFFLPVLPPFFVFFLTFIISVITFQRERVRGTLERLQIAPISFYQVILGYIGGFVSFASIQAAIIITYFVMLISYPLSVNQLVGMGVLMFVLLLIALTLGLLASFVAHNEFQAVQMVPLVILPQLFLSDIIWSVDSFPRVLQWVAYVLPLTHANIAVRDVLLKDHPLWQSWPELLILSGFFVLFLLILLSVARTPTGGADKAAPA